nr:MAG TPA: hypothetical protein [Caudoviricetes sp.]
MRSALKPAANFVSNIVFSYMKRRRVYKKNGKKDF